MAQQRTRTLPGTTNRSSIFFTASHDKRNMLWKAFRKTVLEPHCIHIFESAVTDKIPEVLLELVEQMCQNLDRHEEQAASFRTAVAQGRGFGPSPIFPPDVVPPVNSQIGLSRCMEPDFHKETLPPQEISLHMPLFEMPIPRPGLACGFSSQAFSAKELRSLPAWVTVVGTYSDYDTGQIQPGQAVHVPFLMFERTYGHARHEIEAAMNYCAMDGATALRAISLLFDKAWVQDDWNRPASPIVFSCTVDDDVGIIHHHWTDENKEFMAAPLCKFDLRDAEHFMHFLAWIEAIEQWAVYFLLPDVKEALSILSGTSEAKVLSTPITIEEKHEKLKQAMKLAFENIPWRNERIQGAPLAVTAAMRVKSSNPEEMTGLGGNLIPSSTSIRSRTSGVSTVDSCMSAVPATLPSRTISESRSYPSPVPASHSTATAMTDQSRNNASTSTFTAGNFLERSQSPKRTHAEMLPPSRPNSLPQSYTPVMSGPALSTGAVPMLPSKVDSVVRSKTSAMPSPVYSTDSNIHTNGTIPRSYTPGIQSPPMSANSMEATSTTYVHHNIPRSKTPGSQQQSPIPAGLAISTEFPGVHSHVSETTPATVIRYVPPVQLSDATTTVMKPDTIEKEPQVSLATHAVPAPKPLPHIPLPLIISSTSTPPPSTATSISSASSVQTKRSLSSLRQHKRIRSPATPESMSSVNHSPTNSSTSVRTKISNSLGMIKEHALSRPKRVRMDNSGPPAPKPGEGPLLTPAYDKRRFQSAGDESSPGQTNAWVEPGLQERVLVSIEGGARSTAESTGVRTPGSTATGTGSTIATSTSQGKQTKNLAPARTMIQASPSLTQAVIPNAGNSNYLPLRNYGGISEGTKAVTITAGMM